MMRPFGSPAVGPGMPKPSSPSGGRSSRGFTQGAQGAARVASVPLAGRAGAEPHFRPNDPYYAQQSGLARMTGPAAWNTTLGSASVTVAVLDTGIDRTHADFAGSRVLAGYNFVSDSTDTSD